MSNYSEAMELLQGVIDCAEDGCFGPEFIECDDDCECIVCDIRKFIALKEEAIG